MNINEIEEKILSVGSDSVEYFGGRFTGGYYLQQSPDELSNFIKMIFDSDKQIKNYLEIGSATCGLMRILNDMFIFENNVTIDIGERINQGQALLDAYNENIKHIPAFKLFRGSSHSNKAEEFLNDLGFKYDLIFIDGDHTIQGIKQDAYLAKKFLRESGILVFHDSWYDEPKMALSEIIQAFKPIKTTEFISQKYRTKGILCLEF